MSSGKKSDLTIILQKCVGVAALCSLMFASVGKQSCRCCLLLPPQRLIDFANSLPWLWLTSAGFHAADAREENDVPSTNLMPSEYWWWQRGPGTRLIPLKYWWFYRPHPATLLSCLVNMDCLALLVVMSSWTFWHC